MPSSKSRRILRIAGRVALGGLGALLLAFTLLVLFTGPLVDYVLVRTSESFNGDVKVRDASLGLDGVHFQDLQLTDADGHAILTATRGAVGLHPFRLLQQGQWIHMLGDLTLEEPGFQVEISEEGRLNLARLVPSPRPQARPLLPEYTGTLRVRDGWVSFSDLRREGFRYQLKDWSGGMEFRRGESASLEFRWVPVQDERGQLLLRGRMHPTAPQFDLELEVDGLLARRVAEHPMIRQRVSVHSGRLDGSVWVAASSDRWEDVPEALGYGGRLDISRGEVRVPGLAPPLRQVEARLELVPGMLLVRKAQANLLGMGVQTHGRILFPPQGRVDLLVVVPRLRTAALNALLDRTLPVEGQGRMELTLAGPFGDLHARGQLVAERLRLQDQVLSDARVRFRVDGRLVALESVRALAGQGVVEGGGYILLGDDTQLALRLSGTDTSLAGLSPIGGQAGEFELSVVGSARSPLVMGSSGRVSGFEGLGGQLDWVSGRFLYHDGGLVVVDGAVALSNGLVQVPFAHYDLRDPWISALVSTTGFSLPPRHLAGLGDLSGQVRGRFRVEGRPTALESLSAFGVSEGTDLQIGHLAVSGLRGAVGLQDLQLLIAGVTGQAGGGSLDVSGWIGLAGNSSDLVVQGSGVDLSVLAAILERPLPVALPGPGEVLLNWTSEGRGHPGWVTVAADSPGGEGYGPYQAAGYGFVGAAGLGAVGWMQDLPLAPRRLTRTLDLTGTVTGQVGAWGPRDNWNFAYRADLEGSEATGLLGDRISGVGEGRVQGPWVHLGDNFLAWRYDRPPVPASATGLEGQAVPWYGPVLASRLDVDPVAAPPLPEGGSVAVTGAFRLGAPPDYRIRYSATGVDVGWLAAQDWLPEAGRLARALNIRSGVAHSAGIVSSDHGLPRLSRGSWVDAPWLVVGSDARGPQVFSAVGNIWTGPNEGGRAGAVHLDPLVASREPYDPDLPSPPVARTGSRGFEEQDLVVLTGTVHGPEVDLAVSGSGWDLADALAFAPAAAEFPSDMVTGSLRVQGLKVRGRLGDDFLSSLDVTGSLALEHGFVRIAGYPVPVERLAATVTQRQRQLVLADLELDSGPLHLEGSGTRSAAGRWNADLWAEEFPLSYLHYLGSPFTRLTGLGRMALLLDSGAARPSVYLGFEGQDVVLQAEPADVEFPRVTLGRVREVEGGVRTGPDLGLRISPSELGLALDVPPGAVEVLARREGDQDEARLTAQGTMELSLATPGSLAAWFTGPGGPDFGVGAEPFRVQAQDLHGNLLLALAGLPPTERRFTFSGALSLLGQWDRDHALAGQGGRPLYALSVSRLDMGRTSGEDWEGLELAGTLEAAYRREGRVGRLVVAPFQMVGHEGGTGSVTGQADLVLTRGPGAADAPSNRLEVRAHDVPLVDLAFLNPAIQHFGRLEDLVLTATGPLLTPDLQMALRLVDGRIGPLQIDSLEGGVQGSSGPAGYELRVVGPDGGPARMFFGATSSSEQTVELSGSLPLAVEAGPEPDTGRLEPVWAGATVTSGGEMHLAARMIDSGLRLVDDLVPGVTSTAGRLEGAIELSGTFARPELAGRLDIRDGAVVHEQVGTFSGLQVHTVFQEIPAEQAEPTLGYVPSGEIVSRLEIEQFEGLLGGKPFTVRGKAEMAGLEPVNVAVALNGDSLPLRWGDLFEGVADVSLDLIARPGRREGVQGTTLIPIVTGSVNVQRGDVTVPLSGLGEEVAQGPKSPRIPVDYRVRLTMGDDVWVHLLGSRIRAQGELWVLPHPETEEPVLAGSVDLSRGVLNLPFYDISFRVRQGRATFERSRIPTLENVEAETELAGYEITAFVSGTYPDLRFDFVSNPPLAQAEIQRLLAVGGLSPLVPGVPGVAGMGPEAANLGSFVAGQGISLVSQLVTTPISREIGRMLFLTDFSFEFVPPYSFIVKVAKALDDRDRFLLTLTRVIRGGTGQDESLYGLEWRFQRHLLTRVGFDEFGQIRTWFQGLWDF